MPRVTTRRWSQHVMETSNALDLEEGVFKKKNPREIARSLKRSAERSKRRKSEPLRSAMSMLSFYINRAGRGLSREQKDVLEKSKDELRKLYHRPPKRFLAGFLRSGHCAGKSIYRRETERHSQDYINVALKIAERVILRYRNSLLLK